MRRAFSPFNMVSVALGLAFLYLPIVILVIYSFNDSKLVAVWGGWSLRWYRALLDDSAILQAAWVSLRIALLSATVSPRCSARSRRSRSCAWDASAAGLPFSAMVYAPMVMPEVIIGLSLLLLFVAIDIDRGFWTTMLAHTTLTMCFVTVIVQSRLMSFDWSLEEAAMDLGCPPLRAFFTVTLPLILPAIAAGFMLAFTLSLDDLVIASFTTGPGATTLPIRIYSRGAARRETGDQRDLHADDRFRGGVVVTGSLLAKRYAAAETDEPRARANVTERFQPCALRPQFARRAAEALSEHAAEMRGIVEAPAEGDLGDRAVGERRIADVAFGAVEPLIPDPAIERKRLAREGAIDRARRQAQMRRDRVDR